MTTSAPRYELRLKITIPNSLGKSDHGGMNPKSPATQQLALSFRALLSRGGAQH
jgi:hypothetical protein